MGKTMMRRLGQSGILVSALGFGCWAMGGTAWSGESSLGWGEVDDRETVRAIHSALDLGVNFFDTADVYGAGHSERLLGQALADRRDKAVISTKFGIGYDEKTRQVGDAFTSPEYIRKACDKSLQRLQVDYIDLYLFHLSWYPVHEADEVLLTLEKLVEAGKIRAYGWSTDDPTRAGAFAQGSHCHAVQFQENVLDDHPEMIALCQDLDLAGINRSPLAMGLITGKYRANTHLGDNDVRGIYSPDWVRYFKDGRPNRKFLKMVDAIREILTSSGRTLAQGALAWLWARSPLMIPIPGFRLVKQVEENARAMQFGPLHPNQMKEIERLILRSDMKRSIVYQKLKQGLGLIKRG